MNVHTVGSFGKGIGIHIEAKLYLYGIEVIFKYSGLMEAIDAHPIGVQKARSTSDSCRAEYARVLGPIWEPHWTFKMFSMFLPLALHVLTSMNHLSLVGRLFGATRISLG